jgi:non-homologous end joining protein Ku
LAQFFIHPYQKYNIATAAILKCLELLHSESSSISRPSARFHIVGSKPGKFEPKKFEDHYENALKELLRKKQKGEKIERPSEAAPTNVVNLMEALRQSVKPEGGKQSRATSTPSKKG